MAQQVQYGHTPLSLGALAAKTSASQIMQIDGSRLQGVRLKKLKATFSFIGKTAANGPVSIGLALGLSATEIGEAMEADPQGEMDEPASERGNRRVMVIGTISQNATGSDSTPDEISPYRTIRFPWKKIPEGVSLFFFAHNHGAGTLTTGTIITMEWIAVQEWMED